MSLEMRPPGQCLRCLTVSGLPPRDGWYRCGNCGNKWEIEPPPGPPILAPSSTVEQLLEALRARGAVLLGVTPHAGKGAEVSIGIGALSIPISVEADAEVFSKSIAALDEVLGVLRRIG